MTLNVREMTRSELLHWANLRPSCFSVLSMEAYMIQAAQDELARRDNDQEESN